MTDDFEKRVESTDRLAKRLAEIRHDNATVYDEYKRCLMLEEAAWKAEKKKFGGDFASESMIEKKADEYQNQLFIEEKAKPKSKQKSPKRLTGLMKLKVLIAMLESFTRMKKETITLQDMEDWADVRKRNEEVHAMGKSELLNEMGVGNINVKSTQFFQTKINDNFVRLYPDNAYVTKSAPFKSHFKVKEWLKWLKANESKLAEGKQGSGVKS
jgi:hypothetical protein